jgi:hypothetical protein
LNLGRTQSAFTRRRRGLEGPAAKEIAVSRLFNAYVMVDWSAASAPKTGKDSVWIGVLKRDVRFRFAFEAHNPATREAAVSLLRDLLADLRRRGERVLVGFDFPLGFPRGTAAQLKLEPADWSGMFAFLAHNVVDKATNVNNRFAVAAKINRLMTDEPRPFWGCPTNDAQRWLTTTKPVGEFTDTPPALRHAEQLTQGRGKAGAKSIWQTFGNGTVGGQALVGMPRVKQLADEMGDKAKIWPFQTGWRTQTEADLGGVEAVFAEVYPALSDAKPDPGEVLDRAQVRALCEGFSRLDEAGKLGAAFGPQTAATTDVLDDVEREEGWILGV